MKELNILGIKVTPAETWELHHEITRLIAQGGPAFILSGNTHGINLARKYKWLGEFYNRADLVRVDGAGVILAARLLGHRIPGRITWADWGFPLAAYLSKQNHSIFLLGSPKTVADAAANRLKRHAPGLHIAGTHHGFFEKTGLQSAAVIRKINRVHPDILVVGMGMPLQEQWILNNYRQIQAKVFITAGAAFDYLSGGLRRCPDWMGEIGLEWFFRLLQQPRRMAKRYVMGNTIFFLDIMRERMRQCNRGSSFSEPP